MAVQLYEPYIHIQDTAAAVWNIYHNWVRDVTATVYDESGNQILAKVDKISDSHMRISFSENQSPKAIKGRAVIG